MDITNFDRFRAGHFPACLDIDKINSHESIGVMAAAWIPRSDLGKTKDFHRVEVRILKERIYLLAYRYEDMTPPVYLEGSALLWESHPYKSHESPAPEVSK